MKRIKKLMALLLAAIMVVGMTTAVFATTPTDPQPNVETAELTITNIKGTATVDLYQIAEGKYVGDKVSGKTFTGFEYAEGITKEQIEEIEKAEPSSMLINKIAQELLKGEQSNVKPINTTPITQDVTQEIFSYKVNRAGIWIAIIKDDASEVVYNPIFLAASYNKDSKLTGGVVGSGDKYKFGNTSVAKSSEPTIEKEITGGTELEQEENKHSASVGDRITYSLKLTMPHYPSDATNKTLFLKDTMDSGLTFEWESLEISLMNGDQNAPVIIKRYDENGGYIYRKGESADSPIIAHASKRTLEGDETKVNGFDITFVYNELYENVTTGTVYTPQVTYSAVINSDAVVGGDIGNENTATLKYSNNPNEGNTWEHKPGEEPTEGVTEKTDEETVYTYRLAFKKTDEDGDPLEGAVFGVYTEEECRDDQLVDIVKTNGEGIAVSVQVGKGTYWVKEIQQPTGYTLNDNAYQIEVNATTATKQVTTVVKEYTSNQVEALEGAGAKQVGWLKDGVFYSLDKFTDKTAAEVGAQVAYLKSESTTTTTTAEELDKEEVNGGTALLAENILNTKLTELPSTGGMGTTIFTIAGCAIMIAAVGLFFASRKKQNK